MIKAFADFKSEDKSVKMYFANGQSIEGKILEISQEHVLIESGDNPTVVQMIHILYFHAS